MLFYDIYIKILSFLPSFKLVKFRIVSKEFNDICQRLLNTSNSFMMRSKRIHDRLPIFSKKLEVIPWLNCLELNHLSVLGANVFAKVKYGIFNVQIISLWGKTIEIERKMCYYYCEIINNHCINNTAICYHLHSLYYGIRFRMQFNLDNFEIIPMYNGDGSELCTHFWKRSNSDSFAYFPDAYNLKHIISKDDKGIKRYDGDQVLYEFKQESEFPTSLSKNCIVNNNQFLIFLHLKLMFDLGLVLKRNTKIFFSYLEILALTDNLILVWIDWKCHVFYLVRNTSLVLIGSYLLFNKHTTEKVIHDTKDNCLIFLHNGITQISDLSIIRLL